MNIQTMWLTYHPMLLRYLQRFTRERAAAEDLAQITFVRAMEHIEALQEMNEGHIQAWLLRTARNAFIDDVRRNRRLVSIPEEAQPAYEEDFTGVHVEEWLAQLPDNLREIVTLRHLQGMNSAQIGEALGIPPATVRTRLRAARILLRQYGEK